MSQSSPTIDLGTNSMRSFAPLYSVFLRGQLTRLRSLGLGLLSSFCIVLSLIARASDDPFERATRAVAAYGLGLVVPVCTLWVATSLIGDLVEDRLLVYLWLKPVSLWVIPTAAMAATATVMLPLAVVPLVFAAAITNDAGLVVATLTASVIGVVAYAGFFVALSTRFSRALWFGLAYILVWENAVAQISNGTARLAIRSYLLSTIARASEVDLRLADRATWSSYAIPLIVGALGIGLATWFLRRRDID